MKTRVHLALLSIPTVLRLSLVLASLLAMALGFAAPDDWGGGSGW